MCSSRVAQEQGQIRPLPGSELPGSTSMQALAAGLAACVHQGVGMWRLGQDEQHERDVTQKAWVRVQR